MSGARIFGYPEHYRFGIGQKLILSYTDGSKLQCPGSEKYLSIEMLAMPMACERHPLDRQAEPLHSPSHSACPIILAIARCDEPDSSICLNEGKVQTG